MRKLAFLSVFVAAAGCAFGQVDWPIYRGNAQRTGTQAREQILSSTNLSQFQLLWQRRLGDRALTAPSILGRLISHRGFLELVFIADSAGQVFAVDDDLNRILWSRHLPQSAQSCGAGLTAAPIFPPLPRNAIDSDEDNPYAPRPVYVLNSDGKLYALNPMTGDDVAPPAAFVPPGARVSNLNYRNKVIYTTTSGGCGGAPEAVWAFDTVTRTVASYRAPAGAKVSSAGVTIASDGTVYAVLANAPFHIAALGSKDLKLKAHYAAPHTAHLSGTAVFAWQGRDVLAAYGNGLVLLDGKDFGEVQPITAASIAVSSSSTGTTSLIAASQEAGITAFTVEDKDGRPVLKRTWNSPVNASAAPVVANGVVYAPAVERTGGRLYALDERTGRKLYSSETVIDSATGIAGLAVANGHVCFGSREGTLYCFGLPIDL